MKILLVANYVEDKQKSMKGFSDMLFHGLSSLGHDVDVFYPRRILLPRGKSPVGMWKWVGYLDKFVISSVLLFFKARVFDVVHVCDHSNSMYWPFIRSRPSSITCHDVIAIQAARGAISGWRVGATGKIFQKLIFSSLQKFDSVICVSNLTRSNFLELSGRNHGVRTIHNGLQDGFSEAVPDRIARSLREVGLSELVGRPYLLHVGSGHPRKNRLGALSIYSRVIGMLESRGDEHLPHMVFVGPGPDAAMSSFIQAEKLEARVSFVSDVPQAALSDLYSGAIFFLFPSLNEGFGWPIVEAQACGCPVLTTDLAPMNEVGGDGALYFTPGDFEGAASMIIGTMRNEGELVRLGYGNVERYSLASMAKKYAEALQQCVTVRGGTQHG